MCISLNSTTSQYFALLIFFSLLFFSLEDEEFVSSFIINRSEKQLVQQIKRSLLSTKNYKDITISGVRKVKQFWSLLYISNSDNIPSFHTNPMVFAPMYVSFSVSWKHLPVCIWSWTSPNDPFHFDVCTLKIKKICFSPKLLKDLAVWGWSSACRPILIPPLLEPFEQKKIKPKQPPPPPPLQK